MSNFTYALFAWCADDEGGCGVCKYNEFTPYTGYRKYSGPNARPSHLIGGFNNVVEAVRNFGEYVDEESLRYMLYCYHIDKGEYDEACMYE